MHRCIRDIAGLLIGLISVAGDVRASEPKLVQPPQHVIRLATPSGWRTVVFPVPVLISAPAWGASTVAPTAPPPRAIVTAALPPTLEPAKSVVGPAHQLSGLASYYWQDQMTASGERFDKRAMTAAHKTLPIGTRVRVTHVISGRTVVVRINDRGPFKPGRVIDLSEAAAEQIGMTGAGLAQVKVEVVR